MKQSTYNYQEIYDTVVTHLKLKNYVSYDLCDITAKPLFLGVNNIFFHKPYGKYFIFPINLLTKYFSKELRKVYNIQEMLYPQALALIARANMLQIKSGTEKHTAELIRILDIIDVASTKGYNNKCWGQPYDWYSGKIIPKGTPRTTVTSQMIHTFIDAYLTLNDPRYLSIIKSACSFFETEMPRSYETENEVCFSYTYIDKKMIYNANIMAASALISGGIIAKNNDWKDLGLKCLRFTINGQNDDGSWYYGKLPNNKPSKIDNYHTGYVLEELAVIKQILKKDFKFNEELNKGIDYYKNNLFENNHIPKLTPDKKYPIDIQSCAQSIKTFTTLSDINKHYLEIAEKLLNYTIENFYDKKGYFYYRKHKNWTDKNSYIRWGDAWMLFALQKFISKTK